MGKKMFLRLPLSTTKCIFLQLYYCVHPEHASAALRPLPPPSEKQKKKKKKKRNETLAKDNNK
jgi:hypothetical protein